MKKVNLLIVLLLIVAGTLTISKVFAQASTVQFVTIENNMASIENLSIFDSAGANNKVVHNASFDIAVTNAEATVAILTVLQKVLKDNKQTSLVFSKVNIADGQLKEERNYSTCIIKEMLLTALNATDKGRIKMQVKIQAEAVAINYTNTPFTSKISKKATAALASSYKFSIDGLPAARISKISALQISKSNTLQNISIEMIAADERLWNERYANSKIIENGIIELLAPNFKDVLLTIYLEQMRIISYSSNNNTNTITKSVFGLSVGSVSIKANK